MKRLTRQMLTEYGISVITDKEGHHSIVRDNFIRGRRQNVVLTPQNKPHSFVCFRHQGKRVTLQVSRVIYAWFNSEVPDGYFVDHLDKNYENTNFKNLRLITPTLNYEKRKKAAYKNWGIDLSRD